MIEDIINSQNSYDKEAYKQKKKEQLEFAYKTIDESVNKIKTDSSFFMQYLDVQSKFDVYTSRNALLIASQLPNAMQLKDYKSWKELNASFKVKYPNDKTVDSFATIIIGSIIASIIIGIVMFISCINALKSCN